MWMPLFGPLPKPAWFGNFAKLGYIIVVRLLGTLLGNVFAWSGTVFYAFYRAGEAQHGLGALDDQSVAGAVMMIEQSILTIFLFGWLFMRAATEGEQKQELIEFAAAHGVELDERAGGAGGVGRPRRRAAPPRRGYTLAGSAQRWRPGRRDDLDRGAPDCSLWAAASTADQAAADREAHLRVPAPRAQVGAALAQVKLTTVEGPSPWMTVMSARQGRLEFHSVAIRALEAAG